ncbi:MAG TPA: DUF4215 domain-containing protein [Nannocystaceae bacterium]|nr:DUF4215 domain-containing protein [Nannocystaceae bacterium]
MRALLFMLPLAALAACTEPNPYLGVCGNGVVEPDHGEACDDGEANADDAACTLACQLPHCGDALLQPGEACDLGDQNTPDSVCTPNCQVARCGDGFHQEGVEECDEGAFNKAVHDGKGGCSTECRVLPRCGNSLIEPPLETCDDGNTIAGDGCSPLCQKNLCGDGVLDPGEACDDGNQSNGDACLTTCEPASCGDGFVHQGIEECDDANDLNTDACLSSCIAASCGDGLVYQGFEECDDGNQDPADGCDNACIRDRLVFVTDKELGPHNIVGLAGADLECRKQALAAGLDAPHAKFMAWLSDPTQSPADRFWRSTGRYVLITGEVVAENWDDLTDGTLAHGIDRTADGTLFYEAAVWTATQINGQSFDDGNYCQNWSSNDPDLQSRVGLSGYADAWWTDLDGILTGCGGGGALYCFEQF